MYALGPQPEGWGSFALGHSVTPAGLAGILSLRLSVMDFGYTPAVDKWRERV